MFPSLKALVEHNLQTIEEEEVIILIMYRWSLLLPLLSFIMPSMTEYLLYTPDKLLESLQVRSEILMDQIGRRQAESVSTENQEILDDLIARLSNLQIQIATIKNIAEYESSAARDAEMITMMNLNGGQLPQVEEKEKLSESMAKPQEFPTVQPSVNWSQLENLHAFEVFRQQDQQNNNPYQLLGSPSKKSSSTTSETSSTVQNSNLPIDKSDNSDNIDEELLEVLIKQRDLLDTLIKKLQLRSNGKSTMVH